MLHKAKVLKLVMPVQIFKFQQTWSFHELSRVMKWVPNMRSKRKKIREINNTIINDKKYNKVFQSVKRVNRNIVHPLVVIADLRKGNISSLNRYLQQQKGLPDRAVAIELRKLISGSMQRTQYRLIVVDHPDKPKDKGGRPHLKKRPSDKDRAIVDLYRQYLKTEGKAYRAKEEVAATLGISESTVARAIKKVERAEGDDMRNALAQDQREKSNSRRELALSKLRTERSK